MASIALHGDRVLVTPDNKQEETATGIIVPKTAQEERQTGVVTHVGDKLELDIKVGDRVLYSKYAVLDVKVDDQEYNLVEGEDIIATLTE